MCKQILLFCLLGVTAFASASTNNQLHSAATVDTKGTEANPLVIKEVPATNPVVVKVLPIEKSPEEILQDKKDREEKHASDHESNSTTHTLIWIGLLQTLIFALQFVAFARQSKSLNETVAAATEQSRDMKRSVEEASRSASAMEALADAMKANVKEVTEAFAMQKVVFRSQLRAYVSVSFRGCIEQDASRPLKYEIQTNIQNNGATPAVGANTASALRVLPYPLPDDVDLTVPLTDLAAAANLAPHSPPIYVRNWLSAFLSEAEVEEIKTGTTKRLYIFGTTKYKDVFGDSHFTNFCWSIGWNFDGSAIATNAPRHNDAG